MIAYYEVFLCKLIEKRRNLKVSFSAYTTKTYFEKVKMNIFNSI